MRGIDHLGPFEIADDVLRRGVQSVSELINVPGFINLDFADVTTIMKNAGYAHMGVGSAKGTDKAQLAAMAAISSPLLETNIAGATGVLVSITASEDIQLEEVETASRMIYEEAHPDATIIWGAAFSPDLQDEIRVTIIATGFIDTTGKKNADYANKNIHKEEGNGQDIGSEEVAYAAPAAQTVPTPTKQEYVEAYAPVAPITTSAPQYDERYAPVAPTAPTAPVAPQQRPATRPAPAPLDDLGEYEDIITFIRRKN